MFDGEIYTGWVGLTIPEPIGQFNIIKGGTDRQYIPPDRMLQGIQSAQLQVLLPK